MQESQAIDGSTLKSSQVSETDKEDIPVIPFISANMLYFQIPINRLQFIEYLFRFEMIGNVNPNYLLNNDVKPLKSVNMKPFIKGPGSNHLQVKRK